MSDADMRHTRGAISAAAYYLHRLVSCQSEVWGPACTTRAHLLWMLERMQAHIHDWPLDKLGRWHGFVQGVCAARGLLEVNEERERTRSMFQRAYAADGIPVPETEQP